MQTKWININSSFNLELKIDLGETLNKNYLRSRLKRLLYKFAKSVTKTSSKLQESKSYNKAINDLIYNDRQQKTIDKEL